ncbi:MAG: hypothetical protein JRD89_01280 [Deltaproteobacteria bacterium]|nr:hypothetical protein [Deltaproteobacteria bacterium]
MSVVEIQQPDGRCGGWRSVRLTRIVHAGDRLVVGPRFRILVDGVVVYDSGEKEDEGR